MSGILEGSVLVEIKGVGVVLGVVEDGGDGWFEDA